MNREPYDMTLAELADKFAATAIYPQERELEYLMLGLLSEVGETANVYKKAIRDDDGVITAERSERLADEIGDVLWYATLHAFKVAEATEAEGARKLYDVAASALNREPRNPGQVILDLAAWAALDNPEEFDSLSGLTLVSELVRSLRLRAERGDLLTVSSIASGVLAKLASRQERGTLQGSGDKR